MAVILPERQEAAKAGGRDSAPPEGSSSEPGRVSRWAMTPAATLIAAALAIVFAYFVFLPLWHTDLWGHLAYGRYILETGELPATEPLMPLSEGVKFIDTAWLSQLLGVWTYRAGGLVGLQVLFAAGVTLCGSLLAWRIWRRTASAAFALLALVVFLAVGWQHLAIIRPQLAGLACFVTLLVLLTARRWSRANWFVIPLLFALWANLHGSFLVGLLMLGAWCVGRGCDVLRRTDRFAAVAGDRRFRRLLLLTELAAAAALLNPYGLQLYPAVISVSGNANLSDIVEWQPLTIAMQQGKIAFFAALVLVMLYRVSPRRVKVAEILLLAGLGGATLWMSRMIIWWAPLAAYFIALHGHAAWKQAARKKSAPARQPAPAGMVWTGVSLAMIAAAVTLKLNEPRLRRDPAALAAARLSPATPVAAVEHLRDDPPVGQIFNSYEWGDYLLWAGPPRVPVFVASHAHLVPREVWQAYMQVIDLSTGWKDALDRFGANAVFVEKQRRRGLVARLREDQDWHVTYEDELAIVFRRIVPLGAR